MENKNLKSSLSKYLKEQPTGSFSKNVMHQIKEEAFLKTHLKAGLMQKAPTNFTVDILEKLNSKSAVSYYQPVISKKVWGLISIIFILIIFLSFKNYEADVTSKYIDISAGIFISKLNLILQSFTSNIFLITLIASVLSLIIFDFLLNNAKSLFKKV